MPDMPLPGSGEARFTKPHPKYGVRVRVWSDEDLTGQKIAVKRANGSETAVRLSRRVSRAKNGMPALYAFENKSDREKPEAIGGNVLRPRPCPLSRFTQYEGMLIAEDSDLEGQFEQVYRDACDVGLTLVYERTGHEVVYAIHHEERHDGDILFWDLIPAQTTQRHLPKVRVFND